MRAACLLHHQHLTRPFDRASELALIMRGQTRVFAGQQPTLVGDVLPEQIHVFEIDGVEGKINLGLRAWRAVFRGTPV